jgi:DNA primase
MPIAWDALSVRLPPDHWTIATVPRQIEDGEAAWARYFTSSQRLPALR